MSPTSGAELGLAEDDGLVLADGDRLDEGDWLLLGLVDTDADTDEDGEVEAETDGEGLGLTDGDTEADGDTDADGEMDGDGEGLILADGLKLGEPIFATSIVAHTLTPLVAPRSE